MQVQPQTEAHTPTDALERTSDAPVEGTRTATRLVRLTPAVDIFENEEGLLLLTDLPGVPRDAIELSVDKGVLTLSATDARRGRLYRRGFSLPDVIDPAGVEAELADGVLTVRLRKREDMKPRRIEIRSGS